MNTKNLFRYLHCFCAADHACAVVHWVVVDVAGPDIVVCGRWDNSFYNDDGRH